MFMDEIGDELEAISSMTDRNARIAEYRRKLEEFAGGHPQRAEYLTYLADDLTDLGDLVTARQTYEDSITDGGSTILNPRGGLLRVALKSGDEVRVAEMLTLLMKMSRADELVIGDYAWIGEALEEAGRLREALRWFTIPLRDMQPGDIDNMPLVCLKGRYRVRRALHLPLDAYDDAHAVWSKLDTPFD